MQINFTGHHIDVTPSLKLFTQEKFAKLEKYFEHITSINVIFGVEKLRQLAEATIMITKGELHAHSESEDMYKSIDLLVDKLSKQLVKHKEKHLGHQQ